MKGKDLKQAQVIKVELDKVRPLTFDFNALCELQDSFIDPFVAVAGMATGDMKCMRALLHASLVAGQASEDEDKEMELSINQVGKLLGNLLINDQKTYEQIFEVILEGVSLFFPEQEKKEEDAEDGKEDPKN